MKEIHYGAPAGYHDNSLKVKINRLIFVPTRQYQEVYHRPYSVNLDTRSMDALGNMVDYAIDTGSSRLHASRIAVELPDVLRISDTPTDRVKIANGWGTVRLRFIMEVVTLIHGIEDIAYIQGYTDYHDPSLQGNLDPKMLLTINSITNVTRRIDPITKYPTVMVRGTYNVLCNFSGNGYTLEEVNHGLKLARPTDILSNLGSLETMSMRDQGVNVINSADAYSSVALSSKRGNNIGVGHLATVLNGYTSGAQQTEIGYSSGDTMHEAASITAEMSLSNIPFIEAMSSLTGRIAPVQFTLENLVTLSPDLRDNKIKIIPGDIPMMADRASFVDTENTESLHQSTLEATTAVTVSEAVVSILTENLLSSVSFSVTNKTRDGYPALALSNLTSFIEGIDLTIYGDRFSNAFNTIVMPVITKNNLFSVDLVVHVDILADTVIAVSLNGGYQVVFRLPTFADSLYSSVITDANNQIAMTDDFNTMLNSVGPRVMGADTSYHDMYH